MKKEIEKFQPKSQASTFFYLDCYTDDTIMDIKEKIELMTGLSSKDQKFVFDGKQLEDDKSLEYYNVKNQDVQLVRFGNRFDQTLHDAMHEKMDDSEAKTLELYLPVSSFQKRRCLLIDASHLNPNVKRTIIATIEKPPSFALLASTSRKRSTLIQDFSENPTEMLDIKKEKVLPKNRGQPKLKKKKFFPKSKMVSFKAKSARRVLSVFIHIESVGQTFQVDVTDLCTLERLISMAVNAESNYMILFKSNSNFLFEDDFSLILKEEIPNEISSDFVT